MSSFFKGPKIPEIQPMQVPVYVPPVESKVSEEAEEVKATEEETLAAEKAKIRTRAKKRTILTGPRGILTPPNVQYKTLLGQ